MFATEILPNGLTLKSCQNEHLHSVSINVFFRNTPEKIPGMAHMVEHMCFRNLAGLPQKELYHRMDCLGTTLRGLTSKDYIRFEIEVSPTYFEQAFALILRLFADYDWTSAEVKAEKEVVMRQIAGKSPSWLFHRKEADHYYKGTPYEHPVMGWSSDVKQVSVKALNEYKAQTFQPSNSCVTITGAYSPPQLEQALTLLANLPDARRPEVIKASARQVGNSLRRSVTSDRIIINPYNYADIRISFDVDAYQVNRYVAEYLFNILGYGVPSRLSLCLRDDLGLIEEIDGEADINLYGSRLVFDCEVYNGWLIETLQAAFSVLQKAKTDINEEDILANRVFYTENQRRFLDDVERLGYMLGSRTFIGDEHIDSIDDLIAEYAGITWQEVREAAALVLRPENLIITVNNNNEFIKKTKLRQALADCRKILEG